MANEAKTVKAEVKADELKEDGKLPTKKATKFYFRNKHYSALTVLIRGGKDDLGHLGVEHKARFVPFYDTWKGDVVRVGYLETDRKDVADRCREDVTCEEIDEKEYNQAVVGDEKNKPLRRAPIPQA